MAMKIIHDQVRLISETEEQIEFGFMDEDQVFQVEYALISASDPIVIGQYPIEDQVLLIEQLDDGEAVVYVKSGIILVVQPDVQNSKTFIPDQYSFDFNINSNTDLLRFQQTAETTISIFNQNGQYLFSIHDLASKETAPYAVSIDLGLSAIDYRFLEVAKISYSSFYLFIEYDLFRKEIIMKKTFFSLLSNDAQFAYEITGPATVEISIETGNVEVDFKRIPARGKRVFTIYQAEAYRNIHLLGILSLNGITHYVHNKSNGVFLSRGNSKRIFGFKPNMKARFLGNHLYIAGRNTHYAYQASDKYEYLYIGNRKEAIAKFIRPFNIRLLRRYGFFKVPLEGLKGEDGKENEWHLGTNHSPMHPLKLKSGSQESRTLDFKAKGKRVYVLKTNAQGGVVSAVVPDSAAYTSKNRRSLIVQNLKRSKYVPRIFSLAIQLAGKLPKKSKLVIFESFHAKQYSDNPRAIYEYMHEHYPDYQLLWSIDKHASSLFDEFQIPYIHRFTLRWFFTFPRAKYWINNVRLPTWLPKPEGTVFVQTWHGTPLKKLGLDIMEVHMPGTKTDTYQRSFANESKKWDFLVSPNRYSSEIFRRAFHYKGEIIESGYPRNDVLSNHRTDNLIKIKENLGIPAGKKLMLYAPTWRDNDFYQKGKYKFEFQFSLDNWKKEFGDEWILLTRMHYLVAENFDFTAHEGFVLDASSYPDIRDLYLVSDLLITDYSSVFFDYAILERPIVFFMYDLELYRDQLRGFYFNIEAEAPGPIVQTEEELFLAIKRFAQEDVRSNPAFQAFKERFASLEDGHAAERVVKAFLEKPDKK